MSSLSLRVTSVDPAVMEWFDNQDNKSKSVETAIKLVVAKYGTQNVMDALVEQALRQEGLIVEKPVVTEKSAIPKKERTNTSQKAVLSVQEKKEAPTELDPISLIQLGAQSDDLDFAEMMSQQSKGLG